MRGISLLFLPLLHSCPLHCRSNLTKLTIQSNEAIKELEKQQAMVCNESILSYSLRGRITCKYSVLYQKFNLKIFIVCVYILSRVLLILFILYIYIGREDSEANRDE